MDTVVLLFVNVRDVVINEDLQRLLMSLVQRIQIIADRGEPAFDVIAIVNAVDSQCLSEMPGNTIEVDNAADSLGAVISIDSGDRLKQVMTLQESVDIERLIDRCVETGQQHALHTQDRQAILFLGIFVTKWLFESADMVVLGRSCRPFAPIGNIVLFDPETTAANSIR